MKTRSYQGIVMIGVILLAGFMLQACKCKCPPPPPPPAAKAASPMVLPISEMASIEIKAPVEKVFSYMEDTNNMLAYFPGTKSVTNVQGKGLGMTFQWEGDFGGKPTQSQDLVTDYVPNQRVVITDSLGDTWTAIYVPGAEGGTKLTMLLQGFPQVPEITDAIQKDVSKQYQQLLQAILNNIKAAVEK